MNVERVAVAFHAREPFNDGFGLPSCQLQRNQMLSESGGSIAQPPQ